MKVKKNKLLAWSFIALLSLLILFVILVWLLLYKYNIGFSEGKMLLKNGLSGKLATAEEITEYNTNIKNNVDILHYNIDLELLPETKEIKGDVTVTGVIKKKGMKNITLNFYDNFNIENLILNNKRLKYKYSGDKLIVPNTMQVTDTFHIRVIYKGQPESLGFGSFNFKDYKGSKVIYTLNEPIYASTWFPCNDTPTDKVMADLKITADSSMISVSNGVLVDVKSSDGKKTFHWKTKYPIATYLISIYSARYKNFSDTYVSTTGDTMSIEYYVFPEQIEEAKKDFSVHPHALKIFSSLFGEYPFIKEKYGVAEFMWQLGAMEHQSITGIGKNFISGREFFTGMLVHELAHQWWGDAVTLKSWKDIWLNEGFATYSEALYWERKSGKSALKSTMQSFFANFGKTPLYNPEKLFAKYVYNKGAWVLHMLRREVGDKNFFAILKNYFEKYKYKNAATYDFIEVAQNVSRKNLTQFFNQWVFKGKGKPEITYSFNNKNINNKNFVNINIKQIQKEYRNYKFPLDVKLQFANGQEVIRAVKIESNDTVITLPVEQKVVNVTLDPNGWLAADIKAL